MYTKRVQIVDYGPIEKLDISFPFENDSPKPVVLVGENGSGKSILLSHIVNGLIAAKDAIYPNTPEVDVGRAYKLRSISYINSGREYYFARVDYERELYVAEMRTRKLRREYTTLPGAHCDPDLLDAWERMNPEEQDYYSGDFSDKQKREEIFSTRCLLYFPPNRFEEPAWLNEDNLKAQAHYVDQNRMMSETSRRAIAYSPLFDNQNWLFGLLFDRANFDVRAQMVHMPQQEGGNVVPVGASIVYSGPATSMYSAVLQVVQTVTGIPSSRFGVGTLLNRAVSVESQVGQIVPNIFQLSTGETSLLNLFLSILRDFSLSGSTFTGTHDVRGIVVIDEIDLHLHAVQQYEVLPKLIRMFPNVQFIATSHSPLFVLGMRRVFEENGFALHGLPEGGQISPEEFSEFGDAYNAFTKTRTFHNDVRALFREAQKPIVFVEGKTDLMYIEKASRLLGREALIEGLEFRDGNGSGNLTKIWKDSVLPLTQALPQKVVLLFDCDVSKQPGEKGKLAQRIIPLRKQSPVGKGIENLFEKSTLEKAMKHGTFFTTVDENYGTDERGQRILIPEKWSVIDGQKMNLCDWLCENGTEEDFKHFQIIFDLIEEALSSTSSSTTGDDTDIDSVSATTETEIA